MFDENTNVNVKLYGFEQEFFKELNTAKLPIIGWYAKKKIGIIIVLILILIFIYICFYKKQTDVISYGCNHNGCIASACHGSECNADNCIGIGCHAGSCYGEKCVAGSCDGSGCKGGDCYGSGCIIGKCTDPNCPPDKEKQGLCKPNCTWGRAYNLQKPTEFLYNIKKMLPFNTLLNRNYCVKPHYISETLVKDNNVLYNFNIHGAYYYNGGFLSLDEIKNKIASGSIIDDDKGLIRYDDPIINTIPKLYKNNNCDWETVFNNKKITAYYKNNYNKKLINNIEQHNYTWNSLKTPVVYLDTKGNETMCPTLLNLGPHSFNNINFYLDIEQLKDIMGIQNLNNRMSQIMTLQKLYSDNDYDGIRAYMKTIDFFQDTITIENIIKNISNYLNKITLYEKIENIHGTIMSSNCENCGQFGTRTLSNETLPTDMFGNVLTCKERAYIYDKITENYDPNSVIDKSTTKYNLKNLIFAENGVFTTDEKNKFANEIHSLKNNHLMFYYDTDITNKTMIYICFFCSKLSYVKLNSLIKLNDDGNEVSLGNCVRADDFNHYMYEILDANQNIYYKCLKCSKTTY